MLEVVRFLQTYPSQMIPYPFAREFPDVAVARDPASRLPYTVYAGKRLFFPRTWAAAKIRVYFGNLLIEQDIRSPHRYEFESCIVKTGDVVVDAGASEGFFALSVIETCAKAYLIECDDLWSEPLRHTFAPWSDKVTFLNTWLADADAPEDGRLTLDTLLGDEHVGFLKADIEGSECALLRGCKRILERSPAMRAALCAYHSDTDAATLSSLLSEAGFSVSVAQGFMVWMSGQSLSLRRGVVRGVKQPPDTGVRA